jgi:hypothetical protein
MDIDKYVLRFVRFPSDEVAYRTAENGKDKNVMCYGIRSSLLPSLSLNPRTIFNMPVRKVTKLKLEKML